MSDIDAATRAPQESADPDAWRRTRSSAAFRELRRRQRRFIVPVTIAFLAWYLAYVLLANYAPGFMSIRVGGYINIGLLFGLAQTVTTFVLATVYARFARRRLDPLAGEIRETLEGQAR